MKKYYLCLLTIFYLSCSNKEQKYEFIFKFDDSIVFIEEFIMRSEYTIRPIFCQGNKESDKNLILKNLILEKLLSKVSKNKNIYLSESQKKYIIGREAQTMRQLLYKKVVSDSLKLSTDKINSKINLIGREYKLSYIQIPKNLNETSLIINSWSYDSLLIKKYPRIHIFNKDLKWNEYEQAEILDSLYILDRNIGEIVGPFSVGNLHMYIKINSWYDNPAITESEVRLRKNKISNYFYKITGEKIYLNYINKIMEEKNIKYKKEGFTSLINYFGKRLKMNENKVIDMKSHYNNIFSYMNESSEINKSEILFQVSNEFWSIEKLFKNIKIHPLVFRKHIMKRNEFPNQLKIAIDDLVRDYYFTKKSEEYGFDKDKKVIQQKIMWEDYFLAQNYLKDTFPDAKTSTEWLEDYQFQDDLNLLLKDNFKNIEINWDIIHNINLTNIPYHAILEKESYPDLAPNLLPISKTSLDSIFIK
ncbi:MAG: hypothetical protein CMF96_05700 [Candidatus Marinimicrobia bacterium]|nr:hypothetical protein [Candidatus Neomarinimicrobiota bacterium]|tara:strand:- start:7 stop:1428 length:1422 start_codon:yes stop_codon:yes gene_type:complete